MYSINDHVRVKDGPKPVLGEDEKTDMRGWQGVVTEIRQITSFGTYVTVRFDSHTLRAMPRTYLVTCAHFESEFWISEFNVDELEKVPPRDKPNDWKRIKNILLTSETWVQTVDSWKRINEFLVEIKQEADFLDAWLVFLDTEFENPVRAMYVGRAFDQIYFGAQVTIIEILDFDFSWGIFVQVEFDGHTMDVPLYMLEIQEEGPHTLPLRDYILWYVDEYIPEFMGRFRGFGASD